MGDYKAEELLDTNADTEVEDETLCDRRSDVKAEPLVDTVSYTLN